MSQYAHLAAPALLLVFVAAGCPAEKNRVAVVADADDATDAADAAEEDATAVDATAPPADGSIDAAREDAPADGGEDAAEAGDARTATKRPDAGPVEEPLPASPDCQSEMVRIDDYCIDRYEATVVEVDAKGGEHPHSPYVPVDGLTVRAKARRGVVPQGYISQVQAGKACRNAGKRLCRQGEFEKACRGPDQRALYPYGGDARQKGYCNEGHGSMVPKYYGTDPYKWTYANFNDPRLNQEGFLAKTGSFDKCVSPYGVYDLVGNLHEWGADAADEHGRGRFRGGWYGDAEVNGHGCLYVTKAHEPTYHDYSTGFRCCMDVLPAGADGRMPPVPEDR